MKSSDLKDIASKEFLTLADKRKTSDIAALKQQMIWEQLIWLTEISLGPSAVNHSEHLDKLRDQWKTVEKEEARRAELIES